MVADSPGDEPRDAVAAVWLTQATEAIAALEAIRELRTIDPRSGLMVSPDQYAAIVLERIRGALPFGTDAR